MVKNIYSNTHGKTYTATGKNDWVSGSFTQPVHFCCVSYSFFSFSRCCWRFLSSCSAETATNVRNAALVHSN